MRQSRIRIRKICIAVIVCALVTNMLFIPSRSYASEVDNCEKSVITISEIFPIEDDVANQTWVLGASENTIVFPEVLYSYIELPDDNSLIDSVDEHGVGDNIGEDLLNDRYALENVTWEIVPELSSSSVFDPENVSSQDFFTYRAILPNADKYGNVFAYSEDLVVPEIYVSVTENIDNIDQIMNVDLVALQTDNDDDQGINLTGKCGDNLSYCLSGNEQDGYGLRIYGNGEMYDYEENAEGGTTAPWNAYREGINSLILEEGLTTIGDNAFKGFWGLIGTLKIPNTVEVIGKNAFYYTKYTQLELSENLLEIHEKAFFGCSDLQGNLVLPNKLYKIDKQAFYLCSGFYGDLVIPSLMVFIGAGAFQACDGMGENVYIKSDRIQVIGENAFRAEKIRTIHAYESKIIENYVAQENLSFVPREASGFAAGDGSVNNPFLISNKYELIYFATEANKGNKYEGQYILLNNDIYLNDIEDFDNWSDNLAPKTIWSGVNNFSGTFNGNNHTIFGLYMKSDKDNTGFFNLINCKNRVTVKNVNYKNAYITGTNNVGGIVGNANYICIENCSVSGKVVGESYVGGLIGRSGSNGHQGTMIVECENNASIQGNSYVGGLVGESFIGNNVGLGADMVGGTECISINNCVNKGDIVCYGNYAGGIAGSLRRSMNCGGLQIENLGNYGTVSGGDMTGGITGYLYSWIGSLGDTTIDSCFNMGMVNGNDYVGGIVGDAWWSGGNKVEYTNIYNAGHVNGTTSKTGSIFGYANGGNNLSNGYNVSDVSPNNRGTIIGVNRDAKICNFFYLVSQEGESNSIQATGLLAHEFKDPSIFGEFDFDNKWKMTNVRPMFRWEEGEEIDTPDNINGKMEVLSSYDDCKVGVNQIIRLRPLVKHKGEYIKEPNSYSYQIDFQEVLSLEEITYDEYGPIFALRGKKSGTSVITFWHIPTAKRISILVTVSDEKNFYDIRSLASMEYDQKANQSVVCSQMLLENFHCYKNSNGTYKVSFDVYNTLPYYGAVEVYDKNKKRKKVCKINKKKEYQTSLKEVFEGADNILNMIGAVLEKTFTGDTDYSLYKSSMMSARTHIEVNVPDGGYIFISNNCCDSLGCAVYNTVELCMTAYDSAKGLVAGDKIISDEEYEKFFESISEKTIDELIKQEIDDKFLKSFVSKFEAKAYDKLSINLKSLSEDIFNMEDLLLKQLSEFGNIDFAEIAQSSAKSAGWELCEDFVTRYLYASGPIIEFMFDINRDLNTLTHFMYFVNAKNRSSVEISVDSKQDQIISNDVVVDNEEGIPIAYDSLLAENVSSHGEYQYIYQDFITDNQIIIYNITLYRDNQEVQPDGKIRVTIPLPSSYNSDSVRVYRVESDGKYTDMKAEFIDGKISFITDHLSIYVIVQERSDNQEPSGSNNDEAIESEGSDKKTDQKNNDDNNFVKDAFSGEFINKSVNVTDSAPIVEREDTNMGDASQISERGNSIEESCNLPDEQVGEKNLQEDDLHDENVKEHELEKTDKLVNDVNIKDKKVSYIYLIFALLFICSVSVLLFILLRKKRKNK